MNLEKQIDKAVENNVLFRHWVPVLLRYGGQQYCRPLSRKQNFPVRAFNSVIENTAIRQVFVNRNWYDHYLDKRSRKSVIYTSWMARIQKWNEI